MEFQKKPRLTPNEIRLLSLIGFVAVIIVSVLIGVNIGLSRTVEGGGEFYSAWNGARHVFDSIMSIHTISMSLFRSQQSGLWSCSGLVGKTLII